MLLERSNQLVIDVSFGPPIPLAAGGASCVSTPIDSSASPTATR